MNPYDNRTMILDLKKYGFYIDKIQAFFVPSLEYRIYSLLNKFVYSADSQLIKQLSYLKRFFDSIVAWSNPLNGVVKYDIGMTRRVRRNTVKRVKRDDLVTCFLNSIILYRRLNKICHELDSLRIKDNISTSLNVWNFSNQNICWTNDDCFTISNTATDCNMNRWNVEAMMIRDARKPVICKKVAKSSTTKKIYRDESIKHLRPTIISKCRTQRQQNQQILYLNQNVVQMESLQDNMSHCTCSKPRNKPTQNSIQKVHKSCIVKSKKTQNAPTLKIIVQRKMKLENVYRKQGLSRPIVIRLFLPCKTSELIQCIFEVDPFLGESCMIAMRRKFQVAMYNVCSRLNDNLGKFNAKVVKTLRLKYNIRPGYISFKLKANGASNADRYLFVARVPICPNICKHTIRQDSAVLSQSHSKLNIKTNVSQYFQACDNGTNQFNDIRYTHMNEETHINEDDKLNKNNTYCSCLNESFVENLMLNTSRCNRNNDEQAILTSTIADNQNIAKYFNDNFTVSCSDEACENIKENIKEISNVAPYVAYKLEESNEEYCEILDSTEINCDNCTEKYKTNLYSIDSIMKYIRNDECTQSINDANHINTCLSYNISVETKKKDIVSSVSSNTLNNSSQTIDINEHERVCLSGKESNIENGYYSIDACSITSFVENCDRDKQLVELNCNYFLENNTNMMNERSHMKDNSSLNSIRAETGCDSNCSCQHDDCQDDFINITAINNIFKENIVSVFDAFQSKLDAIKLTKSTKDYFDTTKLSSKNNLLTTSVQTSRLIVSSKGVHVDISYPRTTVCLTSGDHANLSVITKKCDDHKKVRNSSTQSLIAEIEKRNANDGTQSSVKSLNRAFMAKKECRSSRESTSCDISTGECLRAENSLINSYVTSKASCSCYLITITSDCRTSKNPDESQKSCELRELCGYGCLLFDRNNGVTCTTKYKTTPRYQDDYDYTDVRSRTTFMMTKFRNFVDKSVERIKRSIRAKLKRTLFNKRAYNKTTILSKNKFWKNKRFFRIKDSKRETTGRCIRCIQSYDLASYTTCDYYNYMENCTVLSHESSDVLSIGKNRARANNERGLKFCHRLSDSDSEALSRSSSSMIQISSRYYDLLTSTDFQKERKSISDNQRRSRKERNIKNEKKIAHCNGKCNFRNYRTTSSSAEITFAENYPKYLECYTRKRKRKMCDKEKKEYVYERMRNRQKHTARDTCTCNGKLYDEILSSHDYEGKLGNVYEQFYRVFRLKNLKKFSSLKNNWQMIGKKIQNTSDYLSDDNDCLCKKCAFMALTQNYNNYINDVDLHFKLKLLRYVELCKNVKRALMRTF